MKKLKEAYDWKVIAIKVALAVFYVWQWIMPLYAPVGTWDRWAKEELRVGITFAYFTLWLVTGNKKQRKD